MKETLRKILGGFFALGAMVYFSMCFIEPAAFVESAEEVSNMNPFLLTLSVVFAFLSYFCLKKPKEKLSKEHLSPTQKIVKAIFIGISIVALFMAMGFLSNLKDVDGSIYTVIWFIFFIAIAILSYCQAIGKLPKISNRKKASYIQEESLPQVEALSSEISQEPVYNTSPLKPKKTTSAKKPLIIALIIFIIFLVGISNDSIGTPPINNNVKMLMTESGLSQEVCEQVYTQLQECGIETITDIKTIVESDGTWYSCRIKSDKYYGSGVVNIVPKKGLESLNWGGATIYNSETLKKSRHLDDYALPYGADASYMLQVENTIKNYLKSPSTAKFPSRFFSDDWSFEYSYKDGIATVSSYVDAQNAFGAMIRSPFIVKIDVKKNAVIYINLDGQIYQ